MPKPISEQVIVITGASSGIGRETAIEAGKKGASVVLAARGETTLREAAAAVEAAGGRAHVVVCDVSDPVQVERLADEAIARFGRIDTWVNNAGISVYAEVADLTEAEIDRVLKVNLNGTIYGCRAAVARMRRKADGSGGGTIINVASGLGVRSVPLMSIYCASKHGVVGFSESLRMELEQRNTGVWVTVILPASINTPFYDNARSKLGVKAQPVPPAYPPSIVADAILFAAENKRRDLYAGGAGKALGMGQALSPALLDRLMLSGGGMIFKQIKSHQATPVKDNLFDPVDGPSRSEGSFPHLTKKSLYTRALELHPNNKRLLLGAAALGLAYLLRGRNKTG